MAKHSAAPGPFGNRPPLVRIEPGFVNIDAAVGRYLWHPDRRPLVVMVGIVVTCLIIGLIVSSASSGSSSTSTYSGPHGSVTQMFQASMDGQAHGDIMRADDNGTSGPIAYSQGCQTAAYSDTGSQDAANAYITACENEAEG